MLIDPVSVLARHRRGLRGGRRVRSSSAPTCRRALARHAWPRSTGCAGILAIAVVVHHCAFFRSLAAGGDPLVVGHRFLFRIGPAAVAVFFMITGFLFWSILLRERGRPAWFAVYAGRVLSHRPGVSRGGGLLLRGRRAGERLDAAGATRAPDPRGGQLASSRDAPAGRPQRRSRDMAASRDRLVAAFRVDVLRVAADRGTGRAPPLACTCRSFSWAWSAPPCSQGGTRWVRRIRASRWRPCCFCSA